MAEFVEDDVIPHDQALARPLVDLLGLVPGELLRSHEHARQFLAVGRLLAPPLLPTRANSSRNVIPTAIKVASAKRRNCRESPDKAFIVAVEEMKYLRRQSKTAERQPAPHTLAPSCKNHHGSVETAFVNSNCQASDRF